MRDLGKLDAIEAILKTMNYTHEIGQIGAAISALQQDLLKEGIKKYTPNDLQPQEKG